VDDYALEQIFRHTSTELNVYEKLTLIFLGSEANADGMCDPSVDEISLRCSFSINQARRVLRSLVDKGFVKVDEWWNVDGRRSRNLYQLPFITPPERGGNTPEEDGFTPPERGGDPPESKFTPPEKGGDPPERGGNNDDDDHQDNITDSALKDLDENEGESITPPERGGDPPESKFTPPESNPTGDDTSCQKIAPREDDNNSSLENRQYNSSYSKTKKVLSISFSGVGSGLGDNSKKREVTRREEKGRRGKGGGLSPLTFETLVRAEPATGLLSDLPLYQADPRLSTKFEPMLKAWSIAYPHIDIIAEIRKAHAWELANPERHKTHRIRFLNNWLNSANSSALPANTRVQQPGRVRDAERDEAYTPEELAKTGRYQVTDGSQTVDPNTLWEA
jgi:hypothetical protein